MVLRAALRALFPFLAAATLALPAAAADSLPYHRLRALYPQVDQAVSALPSSSVHGSLNRISALLHSQPLGSLEDGSSALVPAHSERNLVRAIDQLRARLAAGLPDTDELDQLVILQVLSNQVFEPIDALYSDATWEFCPDPAAGCDAPPVLSALDRLAQDLVPVINDLIIGYNEVAAGDPLLPVGPPFRPDEDYNSQTFSGAIDEIADVWGIVHGEPIID